jgi:cell wall-associated NlpC family hydrolase
VSGGPALSRGLAKGAAAAGATALASLVGFIAVLGGAASGQDAGTNAPFAELLANASEACIVSGPVPGLDEAQARYAASIASVAFTASNEDAQVARIALMVAYTESGLRDLGPLPDNDGSLGLFQQRASQGWGTPAEEMDPADATAMFVQRLLAVPRWSALAPWVAAQQVQRSAFDGHPSAVNGGSTVVGGNYQMSWLVAGQLLAAILTDANTAGSCDQGVPGGLVGPASDHGLPSGYAIPAGTGPRHAAVVSYALAQLGKPYMWGAAGPDAFDSSGLTLVAWERAGIDLAHSTIDQQHEGALVDATQLSAGDLVFVPGSDPPGPALAGHVGIYLGDGLVESAVDPELGVAVQSWSTFVSGGIVALRDPDLADG